MDQFILSFADAGVPAWLGIGLVVVTVAAASRVPILRTVLRLAVWGLLTGLLVLVVTQRGSFDPAMARIAGALRLDRQQVVGAGAVRIQMASDGHFWARVTIDGVPRRMLIDSGATITALSDNTAAQAGLAVADGPLPVILQTANGTIRARTTRIGDLRLGNIAARDLAAVVSPSFGDLDVLGMNFLSRLRSWRVEEGILILVPHHPQPDAQGQSRRSS